MHMMRRGPAAQPSPTPPARGGRSQPNSHAFCAPCHAFHRRRHGSSSIPRSSGATSTCWTPAALYASNRPRSAPLSLPSSDVRSEISNAASGRPARRRCTIAGACSGVTRLPCQPSRRNARAIAASDEPPIQIGIGAHGFGCMRIVSIFAAIQRVGKVTGSSFHTAFIIAMPSSMRRPRSRNGTPRASNSASIQPTPAPRINRPCDRFCSVASSLASGSGWRIGSTSTLVPSLTRCVHAAAPRSASAPDPRSWPMAGSWHPSG